MKHAWNTAPWGWSCRNCPAQTTSDTPNMEVECPVDADNITTAEIDPSTSGPAVSNSAEHV